MTIGNPAFCLGLYLTGVHFRVDLQHVGDVSEQKIKCWPIRIREIGGVRLSDGCKTDYRWIIWKICPVILFQKKIDRKRRLPRTHVWFSGLSFFFLYRLAPLMAPKGTKTNNQGSLQAVETVFIVYFLV